MEPRDDNPFMYRENVYKSWKIMASVVQRISEECFVAHLEPRPGVGYDCLSLVTRDTYGDLRVRFMLNRNGTNGDIIQNVWERYDHDGCEAVAAEIIEKGSFAQASSPRSCAVSSLCAEVVEWIEAHRDQTFCVGPMGWPGGCITYLDESQQRLDRSLWPIPDHGPEICCGIQTREVVRFSQV
jgi:hypothetical protein